MPDHNLKNFPTTRITLEDGMAVTARVWGDAHNHHDLRQRYHELLLHASGIVSGLEVVPSARPFMVDIKPGVAIDPAGDVIVIQETKSYQIGSAPGLWYLLLSYGESITNQDSLDGPRLIHSECIIQAVSEPPTFPYIEVARVVMSGGEQVRSAVRPELPGPNELDLRFRPSALVKSPEDQQIGRIGVVYSSKFAQPEEDGHGAVFLAQALRKSGKKVWVDDSISLDARRPRPDSPSPLDAYTLIYLVGVSQFQLDEGDVNVLKEYVRNGGTLLIESCLQIPSENRQALWNLANSFEGQLIPLDRRHPLSLTPHLFGTYPPGFETDEKQAVTLSDGIIFSTCDYGCLWRGERRGRPATREEIRTAEEWGENLLTYALQRKGKPSR